MKFWQHFSKKHTSVKCLNSYTKSCQQNLEEKTNVWNLNNSPTQTQHLEQDDLLSEWLGHQVSQSSVLVNPKQSSIWISFIRMCFSINWEKLIKEHLLFWLTQRKCLMNFYGSVKTVKELKNIYSSIRFHILIFSFRVSIVLIWMFLPIICLHSVTTKS